MSFLRTRHGMCRALTAAVLVLFLIGCFWAISSLTEVNSSQEASSRKKAIKPISNDAKPLGRESAQFDDYNNNKQERVKGVLRENIPMNESSNNKFLSNLTLSDYNKSIKSKFGDEGHGNNKTNLNSQLLEKHPPTSLPNYNLHAFYYPWYGNPDFDQVYLHWNHEILQHWNKVEGKKWPSGRWQPPGQIGANFYPSLGCYSSRDPAVIDDHMEQLRLAGIGVLSISWYPTGQTDEQGRPSDDLMPLYLDAAHKAGLKVTFHSEPYKARNELTFLEDIRYIIDRYGSHPAFYRHKVKGRSLPMFYVYDSYLTNATRWSRVFGAHGDLSVRNSKYDGIFLGLYVETKHRKEILTGKFDGFYTYFASNGFSYGSRWQNWKLLAEFARQHSLLFVPSVGPGYIDTQVRPWNRVNTKQRENGNYYDRSFQSAVNVKPSIISVTSFNEWHEGTQIERAVPKRFGNFTYLDYGSGGPDKYLLLTQKWAKLFPGAG